MSCVSFEIISLKGYTPETWRAASKKRRLQRRLNTVFLTFKDRLGNILKKRSPQSLSLKEMMMSTRKLESWMVLNRLVWQTAVEEVLVW